MAQKKKRQTKAQRERSIRHVLLGCGLFLFVFGMFALLRLGFLGILVANILRMMVGNTYLFAALLLVVYGGYLLLFQHEPSFRNHHLVVGGFLVYGGILLFLHGMMFQPLDPSQRRMAIQLTWSRIIIDLQTNLLTQSLGGGMVGACLYALCYFLLAQPGVYLISVACIIIGLFQMFHITMAQVADTLSDFGSRLSDLGLLLQDRARTINEQRAIKREARLAQYHREKELHQTAEESTKMDSEPEIEAMDDFPIPDPMMDPVDDKIAVDTIVEPYQPSEPPVQPVEDIKPEPSMDMMFQSEDDDDYVLPPIQLLNEIPKTDQTNEKRMVERKKKILEQTFDSFGVDATVEDYYVGPAITKFEIKLAVGVKVSKIVNLADDLALALAAKDVRIEAPIPGKSLIGIEVPNQSVSMVGFRDVIAEQPAHPGKKLQVPLGKDISGNVIMCDLAKMPHLLIAGSTGSGKSVCINDIITSLLMQAKPNEVKFMMVDPKMVELNVYNGIPHLLTPVVTDPRKASQALHKVVEEMERRYELFAQSGARNITGYNEHIQRDNQTSEMKQPLMPFIVVIVDELADLMMVASKEVEDAIIRLAQMARAAGIHMILATQRPSVDVITGIIKANVPSRIAFAVSSGTDSRTILDTTGAEKLLGRGDMLYMPIGENKPIRVQGAFISDEEVENVVHFITEQKGPDYQENMTPTEVDEVANGRDNSVHPRFEEAVDIVRRDQKASASMLQRRLHIGYNAAANIIEEMENRGMIGPANGSKPREVYLKQEEANEE